MTTLQILKQTSLNHKPEKPSMKMMELMIYQLKMTQKMNPPKLQILLTPQQINPSNHTMMMIT